MAYDFKEVESKWTDKYDSFFGYHGKDLDAKKKLYVLQEFPYPSGSGLHVGHSFSMTGSDVYARFKRMKGFNVLFPMGWDAFGLPTENFAIKTGIKPQEATRINTEKYKKQMKRLGLSFDWEREVDTTDPSYYKWTQWIFTKLFEKGLAHKEEMPINWCPSCKIGLANEEVIDGKCERCGTQTERRNISQWIVKITDYAERLLDGLKQTNFIDKVKAAQVNWIDKKVGAKIRFEIVENGLPRSARNDNYIEVFTTRPDTLEGATFMVVAPEHPLVAGIASVRSTETRNDEIIEKIRNYVVEAKKKGELERAELSKEKTGVFSGLYAINPATKKEIPVWIADYVLISYGTGAIMSVPSHDDRDRAFAEKYDLPIDEKFVPDDKMIDKIVEMGVGEKSVNYHLRDWIFSRQHYWGEPIPMIYCENCARNEIAASSTPRNDMSGAGWVTVPEEQLPVTLPELEKYQPTDTGESPLANVKEWVETKCPKCGGKARRETDTMPNWAGSDWYFLRYADPENSEKIAENELLKYWLPVDVYIGGDEHNTLHLLYSRFVYQFLYDLGIVPKEYPEPYIKRLSHGVILGPDGNRMSKSKNNVIVPDTVADVYGVDALRMYLMFMGPFDATMAWNERALVGVKRFLDKFYNYVTDNAGKYPVTDIENSRLVNRLVRDVEKNLDEYKFNTAIARMMETLNGLTATNSPITNADLGVLVRVMAPVAPFICEELWSKLNGEFSVHEQDWPIYDEKMLVSDSMNISVQVNGKLRGVVEVPADATEEDVKKAAEADEKVSAHLSQVTIKKVIYVKGRTVNFVV